MSQQIKFFKVGTLPETLVPNAFYYVVNGQYAEAYLTTSGFEADGTTPTAVLAKKIGNSAMINELAGEVVRAANEIRVVADIDARNAIWDGVAEADRRSILVLVVDATDDPKVDVGAATYVYNKGDNSWVKIAEYESMDLLIQWADIVDGPEATPAAIDAAVAQTGTNAGRIVELQNELDASQTGAGLEEDGTFAAPTSSNYLSTATSLKDADVKLDAALKAEVDRATGAEGALQSELDTTQTGAGLNANGSYTAPTGTNYLGGATSLKDADVKLDAAIKAVTESVAALGAAFNYVGVLSGGTDVVNAFDLSTLPAEEKDAGDYHKVTVAGWFKLGEEGTPFFANVGDGLIFNTTSGVDKIDNTNSEVQGTDDFISVTGSSDTGFVVDVASTFKGRVSTLESEMNTAEGNISTLQAASHTHTNKAVIDALAEDIDGNLTYKSTIVSAIWTQAQW